MTSSKIPVMDDLAVILSDAMDLQRMGRLDDAESIYQKVLDVQPDNASALHLLGTINHARSEYVMAIERIAKAILLAPDVADYHANLASAYLATGQKEQAVGHARTAIRLDPTLASAHVNLGNALFAAGDVVEAVTAFDRARTLDPTNDTAWTNYLFALCFDSSADSSKIFKANREWGRRVESEVGPVHALPVWNRDPKRRLRLAYYLPELDTHVTARFVEPMLRAHDRGRFEIHLYGSRMDGHSPSAKLLEGADHWHDIGGLDPADQAAKMRRDGIDVLAHASTFKARYRTILAHRAAPVQIACINLVSTTGLAEADYFFTDLSLSPTEEGDAHFTEQLVRLPVFNTYRAPDDTLPVGPLPAEKNGYVTFGSFNNVAKLSDEAVTVWGGILKDVKNSKLVLKHRALTDTMVRERVLERFAAAGVRTDRVELRGFDAAPSDYLANYHDIDIALSPFPFGGGTTSYEALWMGVPVVTKKAPYFAGRFTESLLSYLKYPEFVAADDEGYRRKAVTLADDIGELAALRRRLRDEARATIFNTAAFTQNFEAACVRVWKEKSGLK